MFPQSFLLYFILFYSSFIDWLLISSLAGELIKVSIILLYIGK